MLRYDSRLNIFNKPIKINNTNGIKPKTQENRVKDLIPFGNAESQTKDFITRGYLGFDEKLEDGFKLYSYKARVNKNGQIEPVTLPGQTKKPVGEVLEYDKRKDPSITRFLQDTADGNIAINPERYKMQYGQLSSSGKISPCTPKTADEKLVIDTAAIVHQELSKIPYMELISNDEMIHNGDKDTEKLAGEVVDSGGGMCRHSALFYKAVSDNSLAPQGIDTALFQGGYLHNDYVNKAPSISGHGWDISRTSDSQTLLVDTALNYVLNITEPIQDGIPPACEPVLDKYCLMPQEITIANEKSDGTCLVPVMPLSKFLARHYKGNKIT